MDNNQKIRCNGTIHVIQAGDSLYKLAKKYGVRVADIMKNNPYVNIYNLQIGDELCMPTRIPGSSAALMPYVVTRQDTLGTIISNTKTSFEDLAKYNPNFNNIKIPAGTVIFVPSKIQPR